MHCFMYWPHNTHTGSRLTAPAVPTLKLTEFGPPQLQYHGSPAMVKMHNRYEGAARAGVIRGLPYLRD